ncbi:MAG: replicative DNA helicase [Planctomycetota bacterium]|nr:MAG: replicative DNA helicase [Planctomycetota bacterium]
MDWNEAPERLPPQNIEAEQGVIGAMLLDRQCIGDVVLMLVADDFYMPAHSEIFSVLVDLFDRNEPVDLVTAVNDLTRHDKLERVGGVDVLVALMESVPSSAHVMSYAKLVREASERRRLVEAAQEILRDSWEAKSRDVEDLLDQAEQRIFSIAQGRENDSGGVMSDLVKVALTKIDALQEGDAEAVTGGMKTHFTELDRILNGLKEGGLYIIAGRPSMGKSSFATSLLDNVCVRGGKTALLFTLEVTKEQVAENMLCSNAMVDAHRLLKGQLSNDEYAKVPEAAGRLSKAKLHIDDTPGLTITRLRAKARRIKGRDGLDLVVVDYLQLLSLGGGAESRQIEISRLSSSLKQLARELKCPVIALSQLNRGVEQRQDKRPLMGDLRESGSIEQDADAVLLVFREDYYFPEKVEAKGRAEIIVAKNRTGPTGSVDLNFHANMMRFHNPEHFASAASLQGGGPPPPPPPMDMPPPPLPPSMPPEPPVAPPL